MVGALVESGFKTSKGLRWCVSLLKNIPTEVRVAVQNASGRVDAAKFVNTWARNNGRVDVLNDPEGISQFIADARGIKLETVFPVVRKILAGEEIEWSRPSVPLPQPGADVAKDVESKSVVLMEMPEAPTAPAQPFMPSDSDVLSTPNGQVPPMNGVGTGTAPPIDLNLLIPRDVKKYIPRRIGGKRDVDLMIGLSQRCECANPIFKPIIVGRQKAIAVQFCEVCKLPKSKQPVLLEGDAGSGKNHLIEWVAYKQDMPLIRIQLDATTEPHQLIGDYYMNSEGRWVWVDGPLTLAVRYGAIFVADEINMARGDITAMFHHVLEANGRLDIPQRREFIIPHKHFWFVATCNPDYQGTRPMNEAVRDRFTLLPMEYSERIDRLLTGDQALVDVAKALRQMHIRGEVPIPCGTRALIEFVTMRHRFGAKLAIELFIAKYPVDNRSAVKDAISAMVGAGEDEPNDKEDDDDESA